MIAVLRDHPAWVSWSQDWTGHDAGGASNTGMPGFDGGASLVATLRKNRRPGLIRCQAAGTVEYIAGYPGRIETDTAPYSAYIEHTPPTDASTSFGWFIQKPGVVTGLPGYDTGSWVYDPGFGEDIYVPSAELIAQLGDPAGDNSYTTRAGVCLYEPVLSFTRTLGLSSYGRYPGDTMLWFEPFLLEAGSGTESPGPCTPVFYRETPPSAGGYVMRGWSYDTGTQYWSSDGDPYDTQGASIKGTWLRKSSRDPTTGAISTTAFPECTSFFGWDSTYLETSFTRGDKWFALTTPIGWRNFSVFCPGFDSTAQQAFRDADPALNFRYVTIIAYQEPPAKIRVSYCSDGPNSTFVIGMSSLTVPTEFLDVQHPCSNSYTVEPGGAGGQYPFEGLIWSDLLSAILGAGWTIAVQETNASNASEWRDVTPGFPAAGTDIFIATITLLVFDDYLNAVPDKIYSSSTGTVPINAYPDAAASPVKIAFRDGGIA